MLDYTQLAYLRTPSGVELLGHAARAQGDLLTRITSLRKKFAAEHAAAAVELLALRGRAAAKFSRASDLYFTPVGLEQASAEPVARWRAERLPQGALILDLCCGNGADAAALAARGHVLAFDRNPAAALCARANAEVYGLEDRLHVACADVTRLRLHGDAAFFDPSRRRHGRRVRAAEEYEPPLAFAAEILSHVPSLCVKVSPALDDAVMERMGARIEFVSDRGECKEASLWFGAIGPVAARSASLLPAGITLGMDPNAPPPPVSEPRGWLYEPDSAVVRAHLIAEIAERLGAFRLDSQIAYLTSDAYASSPFATAYRILEWMPFSLKRVQNRLRQMGRRVYAIKRRGVPLEPEALSRQLTGAGDCEAVVVLTRVNGAPAAIICERPIELPRLQSMLDQ